MNHSLNAHSASLAKYEERFVHLHFLFLNVHTVSEKQPDPDLGGEGKRGAKCFSSFSWCCSSSGQVCSCDRFKWTGCTFKKNKVTKLPRLCAFKPKFAHNRQGSNKLEVWVGNRGRQGRLPSACHLATPDSDRDKADNHLNTQLTCWRRNENPRPHCQATKQECLCCDVFQTEREA